ncbi:MAG: lipid-A-disaccharide synthase [Gammaproteobacteria bacterium]|nr:lipid-A-disaccharide synthase [Gammaproteobacteria bacterium]
MPVSADLSGTAGCRHRQDLRHYQTGHCLNKPFRIMISAGEASGDMHGALALRELKKQGLEFTSFGMGGPKLQAEGTEIVLDCRELSVIGIFEVLIQYRKLLRKLEYLRDSLRREKPDLLIIVDYPDFNLKLAETARELNVPVLFYISPQVWAWREKRVQRIGSLVSMMAVIFPFEVRFYEDAGVPVRYVGHPLVDEVHTELSREQAREAFALNDGDTVLGILPGSRNGEVKRVLPIMLAALDELKKTRPDIKVLLPAAPTLDRSLLDGLLAAHADSVQVLDGRAYDVMQACDAVMTASGTATLETAMMGVPMTIVYRVNPVSYAIMSRMIRIPWIGLVNIVAEKPVVKEFLQKRAKPRDIAREVKRLLEDQSYADDMRAELRIVREKMGEGGGSANVARLIRDMLN